MGTPMSHMGGLGHGKPYVAIDAATGIPARVGLVAVVNTDGNDIVSSTQIAGNLVLKRTITVRAVTHLLAIDVDSGVHVDAIKLQEILTDITYTEMLAVPAYPTGQCTATGPTGV